MKSQAQALVQFENVTLGYRRNVIAKEISFSIEEGEFVGIVGPNGSGKTTIVRAILGILKPQRGDIRVRGRSSERLRIGYVPQRDSIDPIMPFTVSDVVIMGRYGRLGMIRRPTSKDRAAAIEALKHVDLLDQAASSYRDLSGGQKQRTLIARALAAEPDMLILDEPTNGMDLASRTAIMELIKHFHAEHGMTVLMVSHLLSDVANYVKKIMLVEPQFFQVGSVEEILSEANLTRVYDLPVMVGEWMGTKVIIARGKSV
ncbi:MAG TPA: metal ABC transporter ATP-binding protein [Bacteroidetes bacterium]|nr:metal ABC transporter ATP-binding protein [Bacteroidota bacterium]